MPLWFSELNRVVEEGTQMTRCAAVVGRVTIKVKLVKL